MPKLLSDREQDIQDDVKGVGRKAAFFGRPELARDARYLLPAAIGGVLAICLHVLGAFQIADGYLFDRMAVRTDGARPEIVIVEKAVETSSPVLSQASFALGARQVIFLTDPGEDFSPLAQHDIERIKLGYLISTHSSGDTLIGLVEQTAAQRQPARLPRSALMAEYGIYRSLSTNIGSFEGRVGVLETSVVDSPPASDTVYIPFPRGLSFAVLSSEQIMSGNLAKGDLAGMTVLVATPGELQLNRITTPLSPDRAEVSPAQYSAYAIQALLTGKAATKFSRFVGIPLILCTSLLAGLAVIFTRRRLHAILLYGLIAFGIVMLGWVMLETAGRIIPFGGMLSAATLASFLMLMLQERRQDFRLERALVPAIEQTVSNTAFRNRDNLPSLFTATAATAGVKKMLLLRLHSNADPEVLAAVDATATDLADLARVGMESGLSRDLSDMSKDAGEILPHWPGEVRLRTIGSRHEPIVWLYTFGEDPDAETGEFIAGSIAQSFRAMQNSHASLSAQRRGLRAIDPVDFRVVNAIELIARHSRQLRKAADQIHSAMMVFDVVGYPLHANPQMVDLLEAMALNPQTVLISEAIETLTELTGGQADALLRDVLREGGEASATIHGIPGLNATLRVSGPDPAVSARENVVVLEVFDTTELARLSDLRRAISDFVDVQMRNDLETIALGAALARRSDGNEERRLRMIDKIVKAAQTAASRLDSMNELARNLPVAHEFTAHPIQLAPIAEKVRAQLADFAAKYEVEIELNLPGVSGYSVGDPFVLSNMIEALLRLVIVDSSPESKIELSLIEGASRSHIKIAGGFGMALERLDQAFAAPPRNEIPEFQIVKDSALVFAAWDADFTYESETGKGYVFNLVLRRIV